MATSTKAKSFGKEKCRTSSTPNHKSSPHYLKPTISFAMDICTYPKTKQTTDGPSDDTSTPKHSSHCARRPIYNNSPSPSPLKKSLSISPKGTKLMSSSLPSRKSFSPRSVPERGFKVPTPTRNVKEEPLTKGSSVNKNTNATANRKDPPAKGGNLKKIKDATTKPKTVKKATTSITTTPSTTTDTSPKNKKLVKRKEGDKTAPVKEIQEEVEVVEVVEEKTIQVESTPSQDQSYPNHTHSELKNADDIDSIILSEDEQTTTTLKEDNQETHETKDEVTEEPEHITNKKLEETNIQDKPKVQKEKETVEEETTETKGVTNDSPSVEHEPHKLKFRKGKQLVEKEVGSGEEPNLHRIKFKDRKETAEGKGEGTSEDKGEGNSENVVLKKSDIQEKKESPVFNDVIEETANKLVEKRKSKVKALVGAFETVMQVERETEE